VLTSVGRFFELIRGGCDYGSKNLALTFISILGQNLTLKLPIFYDLGSTIEPNDHHFQNHA
jgi:hypothetical protein